MSGRLSFLQEVITNIANMTQGVSSTNTDSTNEGETSDNDIIRIIVIAVPAFVSIVLFIVVFFCIRRCKKKRLEKEKNEKIIDKLPKSETNKNLQEVIKEVKIDTDILQTDEKKDVRSNEKIYNPTNPRESVTFAEPVEGILKKRTGKKIARKLTKPSFVDGDIANPRNSIRSKTTNSMQYFTKDNDELSDNNKQIKTAAFKRIDDVRIDSEFMKKVIVDKDINKLNNLKGSIYKGDIVSPVANDEDVKRTKILQNTRKHLEDKLSDLDDVDNPKKSNNLTISEFIHTDESKDNSVFQMDRLNIMRLKGLDDASDSLRNDNSLRNSGINISFSSNTNKKVDVDVEPVDLSKRPKKETF